MRRYACGLPCSVLALVVLSNLGSHLAAAKDPADHPASGQPAAADKKDAPVKDAAVKKDAPAKDAAKPEAGKEAAKPAASTPAAAKPDEAAKPATEKVKKGPFRIEVKLDGVFEAQNAAELFLRPEEWTSLSVLKAVEHGATVKRGDLVLALDLEKIDRAIADQEKDSQVSALALKQAEEALQATEKAAPLDMDAAEHANRIAQEDLKQFFDVDRPLGIKTAAVTLQASKDMLEYAEEELRQLQKMYKADEATADTEKIVLKRADDTVKRAKFVVERTQAECDEFLKYTVPRREEKVKEAAQRAEIDWNRTKVTLPMLLNKQRLELEKQRVLQQRADEHLRKLREDRAMMTVKSPIDGIVYYGKCVRGKWSGLGSETLRRDSSISPNEVFMTVVQPRPLLVHVTVPENQLQHVSGGLQAVVEPAGFSDRRLSAIVQRVGTVPISSGSFDAQLAVAADAQADAVMPGMACDVKLVPYKKADALTVSPKAVFSDDFDVQHHYVYVAAKTDKGKPEKRLVTVGKQNDKQVEILSGLQEGDEVLSERPKDEQ